MGQLLQAIQTWTAAANTSVASATSLSSAPDNSIMGSLAGSTVGLNVGGWNVSVGSAAQDGFGGVYCNTSGGSGYVANFNASIPQNSQGSINVQVSAPLNFYPTAGCFPKIFLRSSLSNGEYYYFQPNGLTGPTSYMALGVGKYQQSGGYLSLTDINGNNSGGLLYNGATLNGTGGPVYSSNGSSCTFTVQCSNYNSSAVRITVWLNGLLVQDLFDLAPTTNLLSHNTLVGLGGYSGVAETALTGWHWGTLTVQDFNVATVLPTDTALNLPYNASGWDSSSPMGWQVGTDSALTVTAMNSSGGSVVQTPNHAFAATNMPGTEIGDAGASGSTGVVTFTGTSISIVPDTSRMNISSGVQYINGIMPVFTASIDDGPEFNFQFPWTGLNGKGSTTVPGLQQPLLLAGNLSSGTHTIRLIHQGAQGNVISKQYQAGGALVAPGETVIASFLVDSGSTMAYTPNNANIILICGDSIASTCYSSLGLKNPTMAQLTCQSRFGGTQAYSFVGNYLATTTYQQGNVVVYQGCLNVCIFGPATGQTPLTSHGTANTYWYCANDLTNQQISNAMDARLCWSYQIGKKLGLRTARRVFAGTGYVNWAGSVTVGSDAPPVGLTWKNYNDQTPIPIGNYNVANGSIGAITAVINMMGVNDQNTTYFNGSSNTNYTNSATNVSNAIISVTNDMAAELPLAKIQLWQPFGQVPYFATNLGTAFSAVLAGAVANVSNSRVTTQTLGSYWAAGLANNPNELDSYESALGGGDTHPNDFQHAQLKAAMVQAEQVLLFGTGGGSASGTTGTWNTIAAVASLP